MARLQLRTLLSLALVAALAACASASTPLPKVFANPGGPPFLFLGLAYMSNTTTGFGGKDGAVGVFRNGSYSLQSLLPDGQVQTETGRFLSWECVPDAPVNGTYKALVELVTTFPDGSESKPRVVCQLGMADLAISEGPWLDWGQSEEECPHYTNISFELFSLDHITERGLVNTCGDASPDSTGAAEEESDGGTGSTEDSSSSSSSEDGNDLVVKGLDVLAEEPLPVGQPFTPGRV